MKIVIVDDDILVSSALKTILEAGGEVEVTGTGQLIKQNSNVEPVP